MKTSLIFLLVAVATGASGADSNWEGCTTTEKVQFEERMRVPGSLRPEAVQESIINALGESSFDNWVTHNLKGKWFFERNEGNTTYVGLSIRQHYLQLAIRYDSTEVVSIVCDSANLKQSARKIHKKVPGWKQRLDARIRMELGKTAREAT